MPLNTIQLTVLKTELTAPAYIGLSNADAVTILTVRPMIANPTPQGTITIYNITGTKSPVISATKFKNKCPIATLAALRGDTGIGVVLYERLRDLEAQGNTVDVSEKAMADGMAYALSKLFITAADKDALIGTSIVPDPAWPATVQGPSRAESLGIWPIDGNDVAKARL